MTIASLDVDLFADDVIRDPYPLYREIRDAGPVVLLPRHNIFAVGRYADVRAASRDWQRFSSAQGVSFNAFINDNARGTTLASDPPDHDRLRDIMARPLLPGAIRSVAPMIEQEADLLVYRLVARGTFDAVNDLAWHLPTTVVTKLVGLPEEGRERMQSWGIAGFDAGGPADHPRTHPALGTTLEMIGFLSAPDLVDRVLPDSWAARVFEICAEEGMTPRQTAGLLIDYVAPSLDTTVSALTSMVWLLGRHPDAWAAIRANPRLIPQTIIEAIRLESPIRGFTRMVTEDVVIDGCPLPAGARVALLYGSANRDERKWSDPERFDIDRKPLDHLGFGNGVHACAGMHLAQLEIRAVIGALAKRVERLSVGTADVLMSNVLRAFVSLPVTVH